MMTFEEEEKTMTVKFLTVASLLAVATILHAEPLAHLQIDKIESVSLTAITNKYPTLTLYEIQLSSINLIFTPASKGKTEHYFLTSAFDITNSAQTLPDGTVESERLQVILSTSGKVESVHRSSVIRSSTDNAGSNAGSRSLEINNAPVSIVMETYEDVTGRKVALGRWAHVPLTVHAEHLNEKQVAAVIETALGKAGLVIRERPDGSYALETVR
jgi:hypothetical protein